MSQFVKDHKLAIMSAVAVSAVGLGLYALVRDEEGNTLVFNPKEHTQEQLQIIVNELYIECATFYCQKLRMIREEKSKGDQNIKQKIEALSNKQVADMKKAEDETY